MPRSGGAGMVAGDVNLVTDFEDIGLPDPGPGGDDVEPWLRASTSPDLERVSSSLSQTRPP